jgi:hypothetical protein
VDSRLLVRAAAESKIINTSRLFQEKDAADLPIDLKYGRKLNKA